MIAHGAPTLVSIRPTILKLAEWATCRFGGVDFWIPRPTRGDALDVVSILGDTRVTRSGARQRRFVWAITYVE